MEAANPSVSLDLLIRSLITLGASERELSQIIATPRAAEREGIISSMPFDTARLADLRNSANTQVLSDRK
jgi:hypothetical protein